MHITGDGFDQLLRIFEKLRKVQTGNLVITPIAKRQMAPEVELTNALKKSLPAKNPKIEEFASGTKKKVHGGLSGKTVRG